jgi:hypothetical protein
MPSQPALVILVPIAIIASVLTGVLEGALGQLFAYSELHLMAENAAPANASAATSDGAKAARAGGESGRREKSE